MRWIDVVKPVAFMVMDLEERGRPDCAGRFLNRYLERMGDYAGLPLLGFYKLYRALVRAKVAAIRGGQEEPAGCRREMAVCDQYLDYARRSTLPLPRSVVMLHGLSKSGKSWASQVLLEARGAVRLRSDVERKRLAGLTLGANSRSPVNGGIYGEEMTAATYARLVELARQVLAAGYPVVVDAASLKAWRRGVFRALARGLPCLFWCLPAGRPRRCCVSGSLLVRAPVMIPPKPIWRFWSSRHEHWNPSPEPSWSVAWQSIPRSAHRMTCCELLPGTAKWIRCVARYIPESSTPPRISPSPATWNSLGASPSRGQAASVA